MNLTEASTVLRGVVVAAQPVSPGAHRRAPVRSSGTVQNDEKAAPPVASAEEIRDSAHKKGYRDGWDEGHRLATAQAREVVLAQAQAMIAAAADEARQAGHAQATKHVEEAARQKGVEQRSRIEALTVALPAEIARRLDAAEDDMLALCTEVIVRLVGAVAVQPVAIQGALTQALARVRSRPLVSIALHEADLQTLQALPDWGTWTSQHAPQVQWLASADVPAGGCLINSPDGSLDARLDTQLQAFTRLLLDSRESLRASAPRQPSSAGPSQP